MHSIKSRCGYKSYVIEARSQELGDGGFSAEFSIEEHDGPGVTKTQFYLPGTFRRRNWRLPPQLRLGGRRLMWGLSGDVPS